MVIREISKDLVYRVPVRNYEGYALVKVIQIEHDVHGQPTVLVEALMGHPWDDVSSGGWCPTNRRAFYPEWLEPAVISIDAPVLAEIEK
jgi:hypothetical protein